MSTRTSYASRAVYTLQYEYEYESLQYGTVVLLVLVIRITRLSFLQYGTYKLLLHWGNRKRTRKQ